MTPFKSIAANTVYQIVARVITSGASLIITFLIIRQFNVTGYGEYAKVTALVSLSYLFADFGLNAVFLQKENNQYSVQNLLYPRLVLSMILMIIVNLFALLLPYNTQLGTGYSPLARAGIAIFSFTILTEAIVYTASALFQKKLTYHHLTFASVAGSLVSLCLIPVFFLLFHSLISLFIALLLGAVVRAVYALVITKQGIKTPSLDLKFIKTMFTQTLPITIMLIFNLIYFRIDMVMLSVMKSPHDVAIYNLSYSVFDFLIALPLFLSNTLYPKILDDEKNNRNNSLLNKYLLLFFSFGVIVLIPAWFLSPFLSLLKHEFLQSALPLKILLLSLPVFFITSILQWLLIAKKQQKFLALVYVAVTILNISLNAILIPRFSYIASAWITSLLEGVVGILLWIKIAKNQKQ